MEEGRSAFNILTCKSTGKRPLGRPRCRWEDNIRLGLKDIGVNSKNCWLSFDRDCWITLVNADPPG